MGRGGSFGLARYNTDGSLDTTFGGDGRVINSFSYRDDARAVAVQGDGKIVVVGRAQLGKYDFLVVRYNADGSLDTTFDGDGWVTTDFAGSHDRAYAVTLQTDGKIVVAGSALLGPTINDFALARYNSDGSLDTSFDGDGRATTSFHPAGSNDFAYDVAVQTDGKIVAAGYTWSDGGAFALARYNSDGSLDTSFNPTASSPPGLAVINLRPGASPSSQTARSSPRDTDTSAVTSN